MEIFSRIFPNGLKSFDVAIFHIDIKWVFKSNAGQKCLAPLHLSIKIFYMWMPWLLYSSCNILSEFSLYNETFFW